ncbi:MAG TPA: phosphotransferase family protein [Solirubrobacteraceae bacterium]
MTPEGIDPEGLQGWFEANVPGVAPPLEYERIAGGQSNLTYRVTDSAGRRFALRRPPLGRALASAHDMGREHRAISALQDTPVPVPPVFGLCEDEGVNGAPFFVMGFVDGVVVRSEEEAAAAFDERQRHAVGERLVDTLVAIHEVDPDAVGLGTLGKKEDYVARQLRRWGGQWEKSKTRELPLVEDLGRRLSARIPEQGPATIVHGDYRIDNVLLDPDSCDVAAVLDWELCTLGDPLADIGLLLVYWSEPGEEGGLRQATAAPGFPRRAELRDRYAAGSGRDLSEVDFYVALGYWKLAIVIEGVYARYAAGQYGPDAREQFEPLRTMVEGLARAGDEAERRLR